MRARLRIGPSSLWPTVPGHSTSLRLLSVIYNPDLFLELLIRVLATVWMEQLTN